MADAATLSVLLQLKGLGQATQGLRGFSNGLKNAGEKAGAMGRSLALAVAPAVAIGALGVRSFANFEKSMVRAGAVANATEGQLDSMKAAAREMGRTTMFTATQSAEAMAFLAMAGMSAEKSIKALPNVLQLAAAGSIELASAADIVTNVMAGMQLKTEDLGRANDVLVTAFTSANTNLEQLGQAFKFAGPIASNAGITFEETAAALALMGNAGIQASMAGTGLRGAVTRLLKPSNEAAEVMERLGLQVTDSAGKMLPFRDIIGQLERSSISTGDAMTLFGLRAGPAMLALISQGSQALADLTVKMEESGGTAKRISDAQLATFSGQLAILRSAIEDVAIELGAALVPMLLDVFEAIKPAIMGMSDWIKQNPELVKWIGISTVALAGLAAALIAIGVILPAIGAGIVLLTGPVGLVIAAVALLALAVKTNFLGIGDMFRWLLDGWKWTAGEIVKILDWWRDNWRNVLEAVAGWIAKFINFYIDRINNVISVLNLMGISVGKVENVVAKSFRAVGGETKKLEVKFKSLDDELETMQLGIGRLNTEIMNMKRDSEAAQPPLQALVDTATEFTMGLPSRERVSLNLILAALPDRIKRVNIALGRQVLEQDALRKSTGDLTAALRFFRDEGMSAVNDEFLRGKLNAESLVHTYEGMIAVREEAAQAIRDEKLAMEELEELQEKLRREQLERVMAMTEGSTILPHAAPLPGPLEGIGAFISKFRQAQRILSGEMIVGAARRQEAREFYEGLSFNQLRTIQRFSGRPLSIVVNVDEEYIERIHRDSQDRGGFEDGGPTQPNFAFTG